MEKVILLNVGSAIDHKDMYTGQVVESLVLAYSIIQKDPENLAKFVDEILFKDVSRYLDFEMGDNKALDQISADIRKLVDHFYDHNNLDGFDVDQITSSYEIDTSESLYSDVLDFYFATTNSTNGNELIIHLNCGSNFAMKFSFLTFVADTDSLNI